MTGSGGSGTTERAGNGASGPGSYAYMKRNSRNRFSAAQLQPATTTAATSGLAENIAAVNDPTTRRLLGNGASGPASPGFKGHSNKSKWQVEVEPQPHGLMTSARTRMQDITAANDPTTRKLLAQIVANGIPGKSPVNERHRVVKEDVQLMLLPGGTYQLQVGTQGQQQAYQLDANDWDLRPGLEQIVATAHTLKAPHDSTAQVLMNGEFEGEDLPLYDIELKWKGGLSMFLLHPNQPGALHKRPAGQAKMVRLGFEELLEAQEWYALLAIVMGLLDLEDPVLQQLPKASSMSQTLRSLGKR
eukprot:gene2931-3217_t